MPIDPQLGEALSRVLDAAEDASPVDAVDAVTRELGAVLEATHVSFLIADLSGRGLVRLTHTAPSGDRVEGARRGNGWHEDHESARRLPFDGGVAERALRSQTVQVLPPGDSQAPADTAGRWTVLAPVTERGEALGLLELSLPTEPTPSVLVDIARIGHVLGFVVIANRRHTDLFEWGQRSTPFSLPAEIQRRLLPPAFTCEGGAFTLSAWLEPAADIAGDTFDYILARDTLHFTVTDAMGHGVASALTATLCVGSLRNSRRYGVSLLTQADAANTALADHATTVFGEGFATGLLGRLDLHTGRLSLVNAGHVPPYLARPDSVRPLDLPTGLPLGLFRDAVYQETDLTLRPGDRLVVVTDGMLERNAATLDLPAEIGATGHLHPREATRALADQALALSGPTLADDATLLVLDWHGGHGRARDTVAGADQQRPDPDDR